MQSIKGGNTTMESTFLTAKYIIFLAMELFVIGTLGAALIAGVYQIVKDKVRESRLLDDVIPEVPQVAPAGVAVTHQKAKK
jgi:hypothetical protein